MRQCVFFTDEIADINLRRALWITVDHTIHNKDQLFRQISYQAPNYIGTEWNWETFRDDIIGWDYLPHNTYEKVVIYHPDNLLLDADSLKNYIEILIETMVVLERNNNNGLPNRRERRLPNQLIVVFQKSDWEQYTNNISLIKSASGVEITKDDIETLRKNT